MGEGVLPSGLGREMSVEGVMGQAWKAVHIICTHVQWPQLSHIAIHNCKGSWEIVVKVGEQLTSLCLIP